ncbi:MAG: hypothetical protein JST80_12855 [Bdellovibrionales bacterium]|nr:hypothetical protein [Bdellovibrionales bacterium]
MKNLIAVVLVMLSSGMSFAATPANNASAPPPPDNSSAPSSSNKIRYTDLTPDEREILNNGEISTGSYIAGGILGTILGLGIGNAVQGRYMPNGLIFTLGEVGGAMMWAAGVGDCLADSINSIGTRSKTNCNEGLAVAGAVILTGLRIWEIVDVWAMPPTINSRYHNLKARVDGTRTSFNVAPTIHSTDGAMDGAGLALTLRF